MKATFVREGADWGEQACLKRPLKPTSSREDPLRSRRKRLRGWFSGVRCHRIRSTAIGVRPADDSLWNHKTLQAGGELQRRTGERSLTKQPSDGRERVGELES
ncbi:hypothetical protein M407DRAFT_204539 [Tulasnella calospora MUT 4182]|uniref:Uncharacterized protein n=1 Tax=Tulasnella calospora MUT 4182 TaxID=1051891 RepID=A0A0C3QKL8_9AGAM|nr:hypothetical protein M407DRAFT_204539 [Tulasnella calospora MUT 4182]